MTYLAFRRRRWRNLFVELEGRFALRVRAVRSYPYKLSQRLGPRDNCSLGGLHGLVQTHM